MTSENTKRRSRLFAKLLVEQYEMRMIWWANKNYDYFVNSSAFEYLSFLKSQRAHKSQWCPYGMAVRQIASGSL